MDLRSRVSLAGWLRARPSHVKGLASQTMWVPSLWTKALYRQDEEVGGLRHSLITSGLAWTDTHNKRTVDQATPFNLLYMYRKCGRGTILRVWFPGSPVGIQSSVLDPLRACAIITCART